MHDPVWSPDSHQVAFLADRSGRPNDEGLYVTDLAGNVRHFATGGPPTAAALAWQPVP